MTTVNKTIIKSQHCLGSALLSLRFQPGYWRSASLLLLQKQASLFYSHNNVDLSFQKALALISLCFTFLSFHSLFDSTGGSYRCKNSVITHSPSCCSYQKPNFLLSKVMSRRIPWTNIWKLDIIAKKSNLNRSSEQRKSFRFGNTSG